MRFKSSYPLILVATLITGCRVGPDHCMPLVEAPEEWSSPQLVESPVAIDPDHSLVCWWNQFNDPILSEYMEKIFTDNLDVQIAFQRISQAYSQRGVAASKLYPQIDGEVLKTRSKPGNFGFLGSAGVAATVLEIEEEIIQTQFLAQWEIDLFGRIRSQVASATANIGVQIEIKNGILISSLSEFARNYIEVRGSQQRIANIEEQIKLLEEELALTKNRYTAGIAKEQDLQALEEVLKNLQASLPPLQSNLYGAIFRLSVLIGQNPEFLLESLTQSWAALQIPDTIPDVLPSELLLRRPDIRQAERHLAEYTADLGVAYAEFFPHVNLFGLDGFERIKLKNLLLKGNLWSFGFDLIQPIFRGGQIKNNILYHEALRSEAFLNYQKTVLLAFEETENSLTHFINASRVLNDTSDAYALQEKLFTHSENQYKAGTISKIALLNAKRSLLTTQENVIASQMQTGISLISLYKALGGGW